MFYVKTPAQNFLNESFKLLTQENPIPDYDSIKNFKYTQITFYVKLRLFPSVSKNMKVRIYLFCYLT